MTFSIGMGVLTPKFQEEIQAKLVRLAQQMPPASNTTASTSTSTPTLSPAIIAALHLSNPATIPLYIIFALGWSLELSTHLEEFSFWLFLLWPPSPRIPEQQIQQSQPRRRDTGTSNNSWTSRNFGLRRSNIPIALQSPGPNEVLNEKGHLSFLEVERVDSPIPFVEQESNANTPSAEHLEHQPIQASTQPGWFSTVHFKIWLVGSLISLCSLMSVTTVYAAKGDLLKVGYFINVARFRVG
jgi:hypothetical protein